MLEFLMITLATGLEPSLRGQSFDYFTASHRACLFYTQLHTKVSQVLQSRGFQRSQQTTLTVRQVDAGQLTQQGRKRPHLLGWNQLNGFLGDGLYRDQRVLQQLLSGFCQ